MAQYTIDKFTYGGNTYILRDKNALPLTGGNVTGSVTFGDTITVDSATLGSLTVSGSASVANNLQVNTINGVSVGNSPKFTDTNTEVSTLTLASGSTAGTSLTSGGKFTLTAGSKTVSFTMPTIPSITLNGSATTSPSFYAPTGAGTNGYVLKSNGSGAPSWTSAVLTDENVKITALTSASTYYLTGNNSFVTNTGGLNVHASASLAISGNSSTNGYTRLQLGNDTASTSTGGREGVLRLYGTSTSYTDLKVGASTSAKTITFPDATGTVALTSDIPSNIVNTITTTAGAHTAISSQTGDVSFNVPTTAAHVGAVAKAGDTMTGGLAITAGSGYNSYNEGLRINTGSAGYATLLIGGTGGSTQGTNEGAWWIGANLTAYGRRLYIAQNGSTQTTTYFYADSASENTPSLQLGNRLTTFGPATINNTLTALDINTGNIVASGAIGATTVNASVVSAGSLYQNGTKVGNILYGTSTPSNSVGQNGDLFCVYTN